MLQTWAFSIKCVQVESSADADNSSVLCSPDQAPPQSNDPAHQSSCNEDQRIALIVVLVLCLATAVGTAFVKTFVLDSTCTRIVYPPPHGARVPRRVTDPVSRATFPYKMPNGNWIWPVSSAGCEWVRKDERLQVFEFKEDKRVWVRPTKRPLLDLFRHARKVRLVVWHIQWCID